LEVFFGSGSILLVSGKYLLAAFFFVRADWPDIRKRCQPRIKNGLCSVRRTSKAAAPLPGLDAPPMYGVT
jgi:hypothetical protein